MKKIFCCIISMFLLFGIILKPAFCLASGTEETIINDEYSNLSSINESQINAKSAVLIEANTGTLLYAKNPNEALAPASVTKIMTILIVVEAIDDGSIALTDKVTVSANAASMGGSQVFLKEGEVFTVEDLLKSTVIASANDAAVALAEYLAGSEEAFVDKMNNKVKELSLKNTYFENTTGLDDDTQRHLTSAYDIGIMSRELISHDIVLKYSNIWQDTIRGGEFTLTNTNRLVRYYAGCTGLKTGSTDKAGFCISATAERNGMHLIAVIMGSPTRDERNNAARTLLDYGFATYSVYKDASNILEEIRVLKGKKDSVAIINEEFTLLVEKNTLKNIEKKFEIPEFISAPLKEGDIVGKIIYSYNGKEIGSTEIYVKENIEKTTPVNILAKILSMIFIGKRAQ